MTKKDCKWIQVLAAKPYTLLESRRLFSELEISIFGFGIDIEVKNDAPIFEIEIALKKMFRALSDRGKKVLVVPNISQ